MKLIFIRHAIAEGNHLEDEQADFIRKLTKEGKKEFKQQVKTFKLECEHIDVIYSSALLRSVKTASILYKKFKSAEFELLPELDLLSVPQELVEFIQCLDTNKTYAFVGHEPHLSSAMSQLFEMEIPALKKGEIRCLDF
jgi:phosphohistidine phosphatase SixA